MKKDDMKEQNEETLADAKEDIQQDKNEEGVLENKAHEKSEDGAAVNGNSASEASAQIEVLKKERDEYLSLAQRVQADFDNYRRRNNNAVSEAYNNGISEGVQHILPVLDNLERAVDAVQKDASAKAYADGMEKIAKQFKDILEKMGVEEIEALHQPFDPQFHHAVMQADAEEGQAEGTVIEVFQKGYKLKDKIVRYSMVKVAK